MKTKSKKELFIKHFKRDWRLYVLIAIPTIHLLIFAYGPMYGIQIAFRDYRIADGITGSKWVGLEWVRDFVSNPKFWQIFWNTIVLSLYSFVTFPIPIIMALFLNAMTAKRYRKAVQTISYLPHFISVTVFVGIINMILSPVSGIYGNMYRLFGGHGYPVDFKATSAAFRHLYIWSGVWQGTGWGTILYTSALSAVPQELHEAARMDGATRFKRILYVDFPSIMPTVGIMLIMRIGGLIGVGFDKAYLMQSTMNLRVSEVISTHLYKMAMSGTRSYSYGAAVGLFNTLVNLMLLFIANFVSKKVSEDEISLF